MSATTLLSTQLSRALIAHTIELDNEFERRFQGVGGGARITSWAIWSGLLRHVGDGTTVGDLVTAVGLAKPRVLSRLGGVERWRYVSVGPAASAGRREGYGSGRGTKDDWPVRFTSAGEQAAAIWPSLPHEIERRWRARFGADDVEQVLGALREVDGRIDEDLPEFLPVISSTHGMALEVSGGNASGPLPLIALLARVLMAYTLDFERRSPLALALSANVLCVLREGATLVRDLPSLSGISKEAVAVSLTSLGKTEYVVVEGAPASKRTVRLTSAGEELRADQNRLHATIETDWQTRFGAEVVGRLRGALERILRHASLSEGLRPYPDGWRASKAYAKQTEAVLEDPVGRLPHYPMVLHRGGWPDGS